MNLSGNTILITGGGSGIGKALAKQLHQKGNKVIIAGWRENRLREVQEECPGIEYCVCDITNPDDRQRLFEYVSKEFPNLNVLINNAAIQTDYDLSEGTRDFEGIQTEIDSCFTAHIWLNALFIPILKEQKNPVIIDVGSILGFTPIERIPIYCAAKAGYHVYTIELRKHLEKIPIEVVEVVPPRVETELGSAGRAKAKASGLEKAVGLMPDEYAEFVLAELEKGTLDIFYPPSDKLIATTPRPEVEWSRLATFKE